MQRRTFVTTLVVLVAGFLVCASLASAAYRGGATPVATQQGKTVTVLSLWGGTEKEAFQKVLAAFTRKTKIKTQYETARDFLPVIRTRLAAGNPPMVAIVPRPGIVADLAREGSLKPLAPMGLTPAYMRQNYSKAWIDLGTAGGKLYGVAAKANSKSVVWYKPQSFRQLKVKPAATWAQLMSITRKYKAAGKNAWALGAKDTWTLTDWFENVYARSAGPAKYRSLFGGKLPFTDNSVEVALRTMTSVLNNTYVAGGIQGALGTAFVDGIGRVFGTKADAEMYMEGGFVGGIAIGDVNPRLKPGKDIAFFPFPTINKRHGSPLVGGGDLAVAFADNPEVRQLLKYLASREAGRIWVSTGAIVSPNKTVPGAAYPNVLVRAEAKQVAGAKVFLFDGSDLLPGALGEEWGNALQSVIQRPNNIGDIMGDFEKKAAREFKR